MINHYKSVLGLHETYGRQHAVCGPRVNNSCFMLTNNTEQGPWGAGSPQVVTDAPCLFWNSNWHECVVRKVRSWCEWRRPWPYSALPMSPGTDNPILVKFNFGEFYEKLSNRVIFCLYLTLLTTISHKSASTFLGLYQICCCLKKVE
jgi:hypothetical protein